MAYLNLLRPDFTDQQRFLKGVPRTQGIRKLRVKAYYLPLKNVGLVKNKENYFVFFLEV